MKKQLATVVLSLVMVFSLAACGNSSSSTTDSSADTETTTDASAEETDGPEITETSLVFMGGSLSGSTTVCTNAVANVVAQHTGIMTSVTSGSTTTNHQSVIDGIGDIGACNVYDPAVAYAETEEGKVLRTVTYRMQNPLNIYVPVDSDIETFRDLMGKRVSLGTETMFTTVEVEMIVEALGLDFENDFNFVYMDHSTASEDLVAGKLDAIVILGTNPNSNITTIDPTFPVRMVGFEDDDIATVTEALPWLMECTVEAEFYHMEEAVNTFMYPDPFICRDDLSEGASYAVCDAYISNPEEIGLVEVHMQEFIEDGSLQYAVENTSGLPPYHIGAYKYYTEVMGWTVPESMIPPEAEE
ncbi:MAG: TAXI family TRAP transporter solute-binding subunit [Lachnospiraceae bacterium]|nr:TAXI family TRAP transporter solute-binding subunit [Lachnospiraceae bacterium]